MNNVNIRRSHEHIPRHSPSPVSYRPLTETRRRQVPSHVSSRPVVETQLRPGVDRRSHGAMIETPVRNIRNPVARPLIETQVESSNGNLQIGHTEYMKVAIDHKKIHENQRISPSDSHLVVRKLGGLKTEDTFGFCRSMIHRIIEVRFLFDYLRGAK